MTVKSFRMLRIGTPQSLAFLTILMADRLVSPPFFDIRLQDGRLFGSLVDVFNRGSPVALLSLGMVLVIATRCIDLSLGALTAIACAIVSSLADSQGLPLVMPVPPGAAVTCGAVIVILVPIFSTYPLPPS